MRRLALLLVVGCGGADEPSALGQDDYLGDYRITWVCAESRCGDPPVVGTLSITGDPENPESPSVIGVVEHPDGVTGRGPQIAFRAFPAEADPMTGCASLYELGQGFAFWQIDGKSWVAVIDTYEICPAGNGAFALPRITTSWAVEDGLETQDSWNPVASRL